MSEASLIDQNFNPPTVKPKENEFVLLFKDGFSNPVVGFYDGFGNWKRLVFHQPSFEWWIEALPVPIGWRPII